MACALELLDLPDELLQRILAESMWETGTVRHSAGILLVCRRFKRLAKLGGRFRVVQCSGLHPVEYSRRNLIDFVRLSRSIASLSFWTYHAMT
jgi:hypothetical protein